MFISTCHLLSLIHTKTLNLFNQAFTWYLLSVCLTVCLSLCLCLGLEYNRNLFFGYRAHAEREREREREGAGVSTLCRISLNFNHHKKKCTALRLLREKNRDKFPCLESTNENERMVNGAEKWPKKKIYPQIISFQI